MQRLLAILVLLTLSLPLSASAQSDLRESIDLAVRSDVHSASLSESEINILVDALMVEAVKQDLTAEDLSWRPVPPEVLQDGYAQCGLLCGIARAFGLDGSDYLLPIWLGVSALMLMFLIGAIIEYRHFRHLHPKNMASAKPSA